MSTQAFRITILAIFLLFCQLSYSVAQQPDSSCRVLLKEISGSYKGPCKNGLAEGKGIATGDDRYVGAFLNGLPEGKGVYTYKNGNEYSGNWRNGLKHGKGKFATVINGQKSVVAGYWKDGDYAGITEPAEDYRISGMSGIEYYTIKKTAETGNGIEISFEKVWKKYIPADLTIQVSSGYTVPQNLKMLVQDYTCPVTCSMYFTIPTSGGTRQCNFSFTILNPGNYSVFISNN